jgi:hypothetical protein
MEIATPACTLVGEGEESAIVCSRVTVISPWVLGARESWTSIIRAPVPRLGLSIMR